MAAFVDEYAPACMRVLEKPVMVSPRWSTTITAVASGAESRNQNWSHPLHRYTLPEAVRAQANFEAVRSHWLAMRGPFHIWPWRDPLDFASCALSRPNESATSVAARTSGADQALGTGDGFTRAFQMTKRYANGAQTYDRLIALPVVATLAVEDNGAPAGTHSVTRQGGVVTFDVAPTAGHVLTWGGLFDVAVRFEADDSFDGVMRSLRLSGFADITLIETRLC